MSSSKHQLPAPWAHGVSAFAGVMMIIGLGLVSWALPSARQQAKTA